MGYILISQCIVVVSDFCIQSHYTEERDAVLNPAHWATCSGLPCVLLAVSLMGPDSEGVHVDRSSKAKSYTLQQAMDSHMDQ